MNIYEYFKDYNDKFYLMKDKLVAIKEAERNYVTLTGNKITDTPKTSLNKNFDFSDQLAKIEKMLISYKKVEKEYLNLREKHLMEISKINNSKFRTILKLFFIERKNIKSVANILNKTYKLDYSVDYIKKIKSQATKEFEKVTFLHEK